MRYISMVNLFEFVTCDHKKPVFCQETLLRRV